MRQARAEFGGVDRVKEECRDIRWWSWLAHLRQDWAFGWRMMRKTPAITFAAVVSLALGIGATTAILSLADALLWRTLPVPHAEQLAEVLWETRAHPDGLVARSSGDMHREGAISVANYFSQAASDEMQARATGKGQLAGYMYPTKASAAFEDSVVAATVRAVTGNFFALLAVRPYTGRLLGQSDAGAGAAAALAVVGRLRRRARRWRRPLGRRRLSRCKLCAAAKSKRPAAWLPPALVVRLVAG